MRDKSQPYVLSKKKSNFDIDETFGALKVITWLFSAHHTQKRLIADYILFFKLKVFNLLRLKFAFKFTQYCSSMVVINFLHVNQNLPIPQCMWNRSQANMFVFRIRLLKHLLVKLPPEFWFFYEQHSATWLYVESRNVKFYQLISGDMWPKFLSLDQYFN